MPRLTLKLRVPLEGALHLGLWPSDRAADLEFTHDEMDVKVSIDRSCSSVLRFDDEGKDVCELADRLRVEVRSSISAALAAFILAPNRESSLLREYRQLSERIRSKTADDVNHLISYVRAYHGQHWLPFVRPLALGSHLCNCEPKASIDDSAEFEWTDPIGAVELEMRTLEMKRSIGPDDWPNVARFITSSARADFVLETLVTAETLLSGGNHRGAVVEAAIAMEIAIGRFFQAPNFSVLELSDVQREMWTETQGTNRRIGFTATIIHLLPLVLPATRVKQSLITACAKAVQLRNSIVHLGQRALSRNAAEESVSSARSLCTILAEFTADSARSISRIPS